MQGEGNRTRATDDNQPNRVRSSIEFTDPGISAFAECCMSGAGRWSGADRQNCLFNIKLTSDCGVVQLSLRNFSRIYLVLATELLISYMVLCVIYICIMHVGLFCCVDDSLNPNMELR